MRNKFGTFHVEVRYASDDFWRLVSTHDNLIDANEERDKLYTAGIGTSYAQYRTRQQGQTLKRDNWTTEEVIKLIQHWRLSPGDPGNEQQVKECDDHNYVIDSICCSFQDFLRPDEEMGAMAYCPEEDIVYHIGKIPPR